MKPAKEILSQLREELTAILLLPSFLYAVLRRGHGGH